ncbi:unnamed protein product [Blumeria hordei]|uniref:Rhodopsin family protein n=2 Tax=Blumeria hordei TaxID=2867405 RepID=A0A383UMH9_BLUHO|nr:hypothetical protein BGHDH14_bgh00460 [Blumeria hordei DH14]SZF01513.1 unnamed protein product [Blumeria hordei]
MCLIFTCGDTEFSKQLRGYENVICQCHNCGNFAARVTKRNPWFTFCFVPVLPLSIHGYEDIVCPVCRFAQPLKSRPDVVAMNGQGGGIPLQNVPAAGQPPGAVNGPPQFKPNMQYG